jgi:hypothetical protein
MKSLILEFKIVYIILNSYGFVIYKGKIIYTFAIYFLLFSDNGLKQQWTTVKIDHHFKIYQLSFVYANLYINFLYDAWVRSVFAFNKYTFCLFD